MINSNYGYNIFLRCNDGINMKHPTESQKQFVNAIYSGFELYNNLEISLSELSSTFNGYISVKKDENKYTITAKHPDLQTLTSEITISRDELVKKILSENFEISTAICLLLKEKIFCNTTEKDLY